MPLPPGKAIQSGERLCGIAGQVSIFRKSPAYQEIGGDVRLLQHRGPDGGAWISILNPLGLYTGGWQSLTYPSQQLNQCMGHGEVLSY